MGYYIFVFLEFLFCIYEELWIIIFIIGVDFIWFVEFYENFLNKCYLNWN